jgi:hypothetical protein
MDVEDEPVNGEHADAKEMEFDYFGSNRRGEDEGEIRINYEALRIPAKVEVEGLSDKAIVTGVIPVSLGNPEHMSRKTRIQRPNDCAVIILQNVILKVRTRLKNDCAVIILQNVILKVRIRS